MRIPCGKSYTTAIWAKPSHFASKHQPRKGCLPRNPCDLCAITRQSSDNFRALTGYCAKQRDRYGISTTTLKKWKVGSPPGGTSCHSPSRVALPRNFARAPVTFHFDCAGSNSRASKSGVPSDFIGNAVILKLSVASVGLSPSA